MSLFLTRHATRRMAQRSIKASQTELAMSIATEVEDGYFVREADAQQAAARSRAVANAYDRLAGQRFVVQDGVLVTAYHATGTTERRLLREKKQKRGGKGGTA